MFQDEDQARRFIARYRMECTRFEKPPPRAGGEARGLRSGWLATGWAWSCDPRKDKVRVFCVAETFCEAAAAAKAVVTAVWNGEPLPAPPAADEGAVLG